MIDHVFLPRHLPTDYAYSRLHRTEKCLLATMCEVIDDFMQSHIPDTVKRLFANMKQLHFADKFDSKLLSTQINNLQAQQMLAVYCRKANCGLFLMRAQSSDELTMATFQVNLTNEQIYGNVEANKITGDIQVVYIIY